MSAPNSDFPGSELSSSSSSRRFSSASKRQSSPKRLFSVSRKGKGASALSSSPMASTKSSSDDSPFITPPSPPLSPNTSTAQWHGDASMRIGTQTLIQALQALPWADHDEDIPNINPNSSSDSDNDEAEPHLSSSIHTIYRPLARSRKMSVSAGAPKLPDKVPELEEPESESEPDQDDFEIHDNKDDTDDTDTTPKPSDVVPSHLQLRSVSYTQSTQRQISPSITRSGSMATVKLQRRARLAEKLREVFELDGIEEVYAELPCWLLRSVLLQGYMYLTNTFLCFFAHMPSQEDQILKSGLLSKKASRTKRWIKHWFVLKNDALSWYQSSSDPYFPHGIIDLRYAISCEPTGERGFRVRTNQKTVVLSVESVKSREEWVKSIRKVIFRAQHMGDSVKIAIPYSAILDVDKSSAMDFSETIEVKVYDKEAQDQYSIDSYFFAYFKDLDGALEQIRDAVRERRVEGGVGDGTMITPTRVHSVLDNTVTRSAAAAGPTSGPGLEKPAMPTSTSATSSIFRIPSILRSHTSSASTSAVEEPHHDHEEFTHISKRAHSSSFVPITSTSSPSPSPPNLNVKVASLDPSPNRRDGEGEGREDLTPTNTIVIDSTHTYPPGSYLPSPASASSALNFSGNANSSWTMNVPIPIPNWLKVPRTTRGLGFFGSGGAGHAETHVIPPGGKVKELYTSSPVAGGHVARSLPSGPEVRPPFRSAGSGSDSSHRSGGTAGGRSGSGGDLTYSILETPDAFVDDAIAEKFRKDFAYGEKETLLGYFTGYIFRLLPVYGRLYISLNYFCFKSSGPLTSRTRMALPIRDILSVEKSKATRFGHHGLIVIIKGHEELFFEFGAEDKRNAFVRLLDLQIEDVRRRVPEGGDGSSMPTPVNQSPKQTSGALILEELDMHSHSLSHSPISEQTHDDSLVTPVLLSDSENQNLADSVPGTMFNSKSFTFLTFKPKKSLHFTFLTIGSRGDVQPYIALAKGLKADGHRVRIATHKEFKEWIESHDIEYGYVGGDPAELMRICVENGMFTVSFLKEGLQKFRGWLDDLLKTSWEACQGTDVLVESPSAMGGYHIAEALAIPYFRAFTMTWTRTRAYPHAFAVPERKMGGNYNYMSYVMFDQVFWRATSGQINRWRRNVLQIESTSLDKMEPHKIPFLYNFSPSVVPPPLDWPEWIRITGYWFLNDAEVSSKKWTPPEDLIKFIDSAHVAGKKVVYIGFGSIVVSDPRAITRCVIEAVVQSGVYAILSKGWSDRLHVKSDESEVEEPLPPQIYPITSIPHDWLFQRIDAACHHGGAGTTGASLRAGIPTIIKPFFGDQSFWADRVEALGAGSGVRTLTVESLTDALRAATTDPKQISRAKLLGEQIRAEKGVETAIQVIYRDLNYARSLVKRRSNADSDGEDTDNEHSTVRHPLSSNLERSGYSSSGSAYGAPSEDWSVISEHGDSRRSSVSSAHSGSSEPVPSNKRSSIAAAMLSVLPNSLTPGSPRRRTLSTNLQS